MDIDGEWVPVTNQRCSPNLPSEGGDDWHQNSETSFEQYVYTFDPVETTGIRLTGNAGGQDHFISVGEIRVTANFPSGCTPADTGPAGPVTTGAGGPQCVETDTVGVPFDTLTDLGRVPEGGGNHDISVIRDGEVPEIGSQDSSKQCKCSRSLSSSFEEAQRTRLHRMATSRTICTMRTRRAATTG